MSDRLDTRVQLDVPYRLRFSRGVFDARNMTLRDVIAGGDDTPAKCVVVVDQGVHDATPGLVAQIDAYAAAHAEVMDLNVAPIIVQGGEDAKNSDTVWKQIVRLINDHHICRHSFVLVVGGGAVLDAAGYAAAIAHRGVRLIRFPTTTLAQDDAGMGVKNGINAFGKKNFLGTFTVPWAVINDRAFLVTLSDRDWRAGISEAVKVALLNDPALFEQIEADADRLRQRDADAIEPIIRRSAELHLQHIVTGGDPFEMTEARPLDFGHWAAHKLEQLTDFRLRHGEAVAIGLAIDSRYAAEINLLDGAVAERIVSCLHNVGFALNDSGVQDVDAILSGMEEFREHLGGLLTIPLIRDIGDPVDVHEIDLDVMRRAIRTVAECSTNSTPM